MTFIYTLALSLTLLCSCTNETGEEGERNVRADSVPQARDTDLDTTSVTENGTFRGLVDLDEQVTIVQLCEEGEVLDSICVDGTTGWGVEAVGDFVELVVTQRSSHARYPRILISTARGQMDIVFVGYYMNSVAQMAYNNWDYRSDVEFLGGKYLLVDTLNGVPVGYHTSRVVLTYDSTSRTFVSGTLVGERILINDSGSDTVVLDSPQGITTNVFEYLLYDGTWYCRWLLDPFDGGRESSLEMWPIGRFPCNRTE